MKRGDRAAAIGYGGTIHRVTIVGPVPGGCTIRFADGHTSGWPRAFLTRDATEAEALSAFAATLAPSVEDHR